MLLIENYDVKSTNAFGIGFGYNVKSITKNEVELVTLKRKAKTEWVSEMPEKSIHRLEARVGFDQISFLSRGS